MSQNAIDNVDVDDFFRPPTQEEQEEKQRLKKERQERKRLYEEAAGVRPLRDKMQMLMNRCDRPVVKARLSEFVVEMDNELARLREDPLELDDEDRRELRLFHLRKMQ